MTPNKSQRALGELVKEIAAVLGLMITIFTVLEIFLSTGLVQPLGALVIGLVLTAFLACVGKWNWGTMLITWLAVGIVLIILYLIVSRPATVVGAVVDSGGSPVAGLRLVLTDSDGVDHKAVTDENGAFEIRNVPEGKFTVLANGELLISRRVPSGWERIIDSKTEVGALVHKPGPAATATPVVVAPANTPTATPTPPTNTPVPPTDTPVTEPPTSTLTPTPAPINATVTAEALNLRAGPGKEYARIGQLQQGDVTTVVGQNPEGDWLKVEHEGKTGWVARKYVEAPPEVAMVPTAVVPPTPTSTPSPEPTAIPTPTQMPPPTQPTPTPVPPTVTPVLSPTPTVTPTPTPTSFIVIIDDMEEDSIPHWQPSTDSVSAIIISSVPGRTGNAIEVSYNLKKDGWVLISKELNPGTLSGTEKIRFYYRGSGASNTIELKLVYKDIGGTTFGILWNRATVRDNWVSVEVPYSLFDCWWPEDNCLRYGGELDINKGLRIDFAISNKSGDEPGSGDVMIDDVQAIR